MLTGTPSGIGMARTPPQGLVPGDVFEVEIVCIGIIKNRFVAESDWTPRP